MEMNSVCVHGLFLFIYLGGHFSWRRVSPDLQLTPHGFTSYELEEGKREREERGAVTRGSPPSHHHHGLHRRRATTTVTISTLWCKTLCSHSVLPNCKPLSLSLSLSL
ncbi:hypothetical protein HanIR_Chr17g0866871 [Helianthus annuus]|nr:hypothetical protein HanIR_Chr17g0866871 [Helianthus annuus]